MDLLADVGAVVENTQHQYWSMRNGYCLPARKTGIEELGRRLESETEMAEHASNALRVGVQWSTQV